MQSFRAHVLGHAREPKHTHTHTHVGNRERRTEQERRLKENPQDQQSCPRRLSAVLDNGFGVIQIVPCALTCVTENICTRQSSTPAADQEINPWSSSCSILSNATSVTCHHLTAHTHTHTHTHTIDASRTGRQHKAHARVRATRSTPLNPIPSPIHVLFSGPLLHKC